MITAPRILALTGAAACLLLAGCGQQTDDRVSNQSPTAVATIQSEAPAEPVPASSQPAPASSPFMSIDCATGEAVGVDAAPQGTTVGAVTVSEGANGAPVVTVATGAAPATELQTADIVDGTGTEVAAGDTLTVDYCGVGLGSMTLFDSSWARGEPATFPLDGVIAGWQQGLPGAKAGGERLLIIPGELAYGEAPPPGILPNETLIFVVTLQSVNGA